MNACRIGVLRALLLERVTGPDRTGQWLHFAISLSRHPLQQKVVFPRFVRPFIPAHLVSLEVSLHRGD
jgi:hypothetical protein